MAQLMPLPLTVSCSNKIQIGFTFLVPAHLGSPRQRAVKRVCVCVWLVWDMQWATVLSKQQAVYPKGKGIEEYVTYVTYSINYLKD